MGKHERGYTRMARDFYPTPQWPIDCLNRFVPLAGLHVWECAAGTGSMVRALRKCGAIVWASDIEARRYITPFDFVSAEHLPNGFDAIVTNPPFGPGGRLALAFIEHGLRRLNPRARLALLLPCDFDSGKTRAHVFGDCSAFVGKIILRERIVWFKRTDGVKEAPKENSAWFLWRQTPRTARPVLLYAP